MNVRSMFPSKFVAAHDLMGQDVTVVISGIKVEEVGTEQESRPVIYFQGMVKGMVLNRTNAKRLQSLYGEETDQWVGKPVTLYPSETEFAGDTVPCIRIRQTQPTQIVAAVQPVVVQQPVQVSGKPSF